MHKWIGLVIVLSACQGKPEEFVYFRGAGFEWKLFNHRLSFWDVTLEGSTVSTAVVGGTSTTGIDPELDQSCDADKCQEFPFTDEAQISIHTAKITTNKAMFATGSTTMEVGSTEVSSDATLTYDLGKAGEVTAILQGFSFDSDIDPASAQCYHPKYGWLPRTLAVTLGTATAVDQTTWKVPVKATFSSGLTYEEERECLDAVVAEAKVKLRIDVLGVHSLAKHEEQKVDWEETYEYGDGPIKPSEQLPPDLDDRKYVSTLDGAMSGWSSIQWDFHQKDAAPEDNRGAYIRTIDFMTDGDGVANGMARNYSPVTQLSGFDYRFRGTVRGIDLKGTMEYEDVIETIPVTVDETGVTKHSFDVFGG